MKGGFLEEKKGALLFLQKRREASLKMKGYFFSLIAHVF
jgi:hypothetical protein